jgi:hypothetical protein
MAERFSDIEKSFLINTPNLEERLGEYPELKAKIETMLAIIENAGRDVEKAGQLRGGIIAELRQVGNEVLHSWARRQRRASGHPQHSTSADSGKGRICGPCRPWVKIC